MIDVIYLINKSTLITDSDLAIIGSAINITLPTFCGSWNLVAPKCKMIGKGKPTPAGHTNVYIMDAPDLSGAFSYYDEVDNKPIGKVFVKLILDNGGGIMVGKAASISVSQVISNEVFGLLGDVLCNSWWISPNYSTFYAFEVCDPVQSNRIKVFTNNTTVSISDWILPAWSDPQNKKGPFNYTNTLKAPFQVDKNGYAITCTSGTVEYVFGSEVPQWVKDHKMNSLRFNNRVKASLISS